MIAPALSNCQLTSACAYVLACMAAHQLNVLSCVYLHSTWNPCILSCLLWKYNLEVQTCINIAQALFLLYRRKQHLHCPHDDWGCASNCRLLPVFTLQNCHAEKTCSTRYKGCARLGRSRSWVQARNQSVSQIVWTQVSYQCSATNTPLAAERYSSHK